VVGVARRIGDAMRAQRRAKLGVFLAGMSTQITPSMPASAQASANHSAPRVIIGLA
jgi:hypothetical protein